MLLVLSACSPKTPPSQPQITIAAAANLTEVFGEIGTAFEADTGIHVVYSFASTGDLTRQIENAAPFDVFAAADVKHVTELER
ncbi:MAG: molybdate ABC transporter substrate-binding protein, partial [Acidobacteriota bacterium]|nr:molybdate ABC transporter substrate-binding protein [Acidobacteriota bacterium]